MDLSESRVVFILSTNFDLTMFDHLKFLDTGIQIVANPRRLIYIAVADPAAEPTSEVRELVAYSKGLSLFDRVDQTLLTDPPTTAMLGTWTERLLPWQIAELQNAGVRRLRESSDFAPVLVEFSSTTLERLAGMWWVARIRPEPGYGVDSPELPSAKKYPG